MNIKLSKNVNNSSKGFVQSGILKQSKMSFKVTDMGVFKGDLNKISQEQSTSTIKWNFVYAYIIFIVLIMFLMYGVVKLQIVEGASLYQQSSNNQLREISIYPNRGVITDRYGELLAENVPAYNIYLLPDKYLDSNQNINETELKKTCDELQKLLGEKWQNYVLKISTDKPEDYPDLYSKVFEKMKRYYYFQELLIASDIDNNKAIEIKSKSVELNGLFIDDATKRQYPAGIEFSQILGYTSKITGDDLKANPDLDPNQEVGRIGVEQIYNKQLSGVIGKNVVEKDSKFNVVSDLKMVVNEAKPGDSLVLTIDAKAQKAMQNAILSGIDRIGAKGASGIVQDIKTGEIIAMVSWPSYDNNAFVGGISYADYDKLVNDPLLPLFNRPIAAQQPPGSIFKTLVGSAALDAGIITDQTTFYSSNQYRFSNGATFYEYGKAGYGNINIYTAYEISSNIFFCETIRHWNIDALDVYLDYFGIGKLTGIDLPGEMPGRLPSPENKIKLATTTNPWLESVWYPEGDSCNSVIGQGITSITPIQAVNWTSAIANGGTLNTPTVVKEIVHADGTKEEINPEPLKKDFISPNALAVVRGGMRQSITGPYHLLTWSFWNSHYTVAAKTGTAEFGALNADGRYEHTHAWAIGFFPYEDPKYAFVILLEDSQKGINSSTVASDFMSNFTIPEGE